MGSLATYGKINHYGFIETLYRRVISTINLNDPIVDPIGQVLREDAVGPGGGRAAARKGTEITEKVLKHLRESGVELVRIKPYASHIIDYLSADREERVTIAQANTQLDEHDRLVPDHVTVRLGGGHRFPVIPTENVEYLSISRPNR